MAQILPTPNVGTWLRISSVTIEEETQPHVGTWLRILANVGPEGPRVGTWLRVDSVTFQRRPRAHLGLVVASR